MNIIYYYVNLFVLNPLSLDKPGRFYLMLISWWYNYVNKINCNFTKKAKKQICTSNRMVSSAINDKFDEW